MLQKALPSTVVLKPWCASASPGEGFLKYRFLGPIPRITLGIRPGKLHFSQVPRWCWCCWSRAQALENFGLDHVDGFHLEMMPQIISQQFPLFCFLPPKAHIWFSQSHLDIAPSFPLPPSLFPPSLWPQSDWVWSFPALCCCFWCCSVDKSCPTLLRPHGL